MLRTKNNTRRPHCCEARELKKVGVEVVRMHAGLWLRCMACFDCWSPMIRPGGKLPRGYWMCPRGCNQPQ